MKSLAYTSLLCASLIFSGCGYQGNNAKMNVESNHAKAEHKINVESTKSLHGNGVSTQLESYINHGGSRKTKALILGNTVIIGKNRGELGTKNKIANSIDGVKGTNFQDNPSTIQNLVGKNTRVLVVTDPKALQAMDRVKTNLNSDAQSTTLNADLEIILKNAK
ncbi:hypothetical protein [Ammoniphilus resinae]|uniref:Lipoprotein n=1 Tax=Ammoniphilus resinae TaxID=861532 RepID=A0ABS4GLV7_9BACL|nr:hypothetical protein [Ammoniphilus resinae]MBP1931229.1 hypothetical protein [Ammoniphilus resinae]